MTYDLAVDTKESLPADYDILLFICTFWDWGIFSIIITTTGQDIAYFRLYTTICIP